MLNRTHYKRLAKEDQYVLEQPLNWYDRSIQLQLAVFLEYCLLMESVLSTL